MTLVKSVDELFVEHQRAIFIRTDRLFAWLLGLQWLGAIGTALWISPRAWAGAQSQTHIHVYTAIFLGGAIVSLPMVLALKVPGTRLSRHVVTAAQMLMSALLIHLTGGRIETHFHVFGSLAFLTFYRDWQVLLSASLIVALDHFLRGVFWPESVFGVVVAGEWRWLEHVWWVLFEDVFLFMAIHQSNQEMRSIAERQARANQALLEAEQANFMKDEFLATLSHELRTPLTSAVGWISVLNRVGEKDLDTRTQGLVVIERNIRALTKLIDDLLDVSRIMAGKMVLDTKPVSLRTVAEGALESIRPAAAAKEIILEASLPARDLVVHGDSGRLQQIVWNLLSNSVKFTPKRGRVGLRVEESGENALLTVTDTGPGISAQFLPHLFERFRQADGSVTRGFGGLGLGLAIVRHIAELHGGTVSASSAGVGSGAEFTVTLPMHLNSQVFTENFQTTGFHMGLLRGLRILVVEDDTDTRNLIALILKRSGAAVLTAGTAKAALIIIEAEIPDIMVADVGMPGEDGHSLIRKVRATEGIFGPRMPAMALTAYARAEDRKAALAAGFDEHLAKPVEIERLTSLLAELAKKRISAARA